MLGSPFVQMTDNSCSSDFCHHCICEGSNEFLEISLPVLFARVLLQTPFENENLAVLQKVFILNEMKM